MERLKVPPHSVEAEQSALGSILIKNDCYDLVGEKIKESDFYNRSHQIIFKVMSEMITGLKPVDLITLTERLDDLNLLDDAGGFAYIAELSRNTPSTSNVEHYAEIVKEKSIYRALIASGYEITENGYDSQGLTAIESVGRAEAILSKVSDSLINTHNPSDAESIADRFIDRLEKQIKSGREIVGHPTGLHDLDIKISGLQDTDLIILAARPSMGKTAKLLSMIIANLDLNNIFFSIEMPADKIMSRMIASIGMVELNKIKSGNLNDYDWAGIGQAMDRIKRSNLEIIDSGYMTIHEMRLHCRKYKKKHGKIDIISVDYLQLIKGSNTENRTQEISEVSRGLKQLAKEFNCPMIALSQLNRGLESRSDKRPISSDLRESGQIEQDADVILFLYRDEVYNEHSPDKGLAEIIVGKARDGELGMVGAIWQGQYQKFSQLNGQELVSHLKPASEKKYKKEFNPK